MKRRGEEFYRYRKVYLFAQNIIKINSNDNSSKTGLKSSYRYGSPTMNASFRQW